MLLPRRPPLSFTGKTKLTTNPLERELKSPFSTELINPQSSSSHTPRKAIKRTRHTQAPRLHGFEAVHKLKIRYLNLRHQSRPRTRISPHTHTYINPDIHTHARAHMNTLSLFSRSQPKQAPILKPRHVTPVEERRRKGCNIQIKKIPFARAGGDGQDAGQGAEAISRNPTWKGRRITKSRIDIYPFPLHPPPVLYLFFARHLFLCIASLSQALFFKRHSPPTDCIFISTIQTETR